MRLRIQGKHSSLCQVKNIRLLLLIMVKMELVYHDLVEADLLLLKVKRCHGA